MEKRKIKNYIKPNIETILIDTIDIIYTSICGSKGIDCDNLICDLFDCLVNDSCDSICVFE